MHFNEIYANSNAPKSFSVQELCEPIVITSAMIEATDDDYDDTDDLPDIPPVSSSPTPELNGFHLSAAGYQLLPNHSSASGPANQQDIQHTIDQKQHESLTCGICEFVTTSIDAMKHHNESKHPNVQHNDREIR